MVNKFLSFSVPLELPIITREYFNRWYSLKAYYVAMTLADAPIQAGCVLVYTAITYFMTDQPLEFYRFALFTLCCASVSFVAQSIGLVVGTVFSLKVSIVTHNYITQFTDNKYTLSLFIMN